MSTTFKLGLATTHPTELLQGMDKSSALVFDILQRVMEFPQLLPTTPGSTAWTTRMTGVTATVKYAAKDLAESFKRLTGVEATLLISLSPDKQSPRDVALSRIFSTAHEILARTEWDAAFCLEWDQVILRRIQGETYVEDISPLFPRGDTEALLRQLDPSGQARRGFK